MIGGSVGYTPADARKILGSRLCFARRISTDNEPGLIELKDIFKKIRKDTIIPSCPLRIEDGYELIEFDENRVMDYGERFCNKSGSSGWTIIGGYKGKTVKQLRNTYSEEIDFIIVKSPDKPRKPRFACEKPYPYGY